MEAEGKRSEAGGGDPFLRFEDFEKSTVLDGPQLRECLVSSLPWPHIMGERIRKIKYVDVVMYLDDEGKTVLRGLCESPPEGTRGPSELTLFRLPDNTEDALAKMKHAVYHEVAHVAYRFLRKKVRDHWESLSDPKKPERSIVPNEPVLSTEEEFAECYAHYVQQSDVMKDRNMDKFEFLRVEVFGCREYRDYSAKGGNA